MHWSTDVSHAPEFTYSNVHLLPKTSHLWILSGDQDQMNIPFLSVERKSISSLSVNNDQNSDLLAKRRRNRFLIPFQSIQEQAKEFIPHSDTEERVPEFLNMEL
ncbi:hypothetical protein HID58_095635 [Brassica napus]|uniref:Uncharacterized protein n=1 Tax=Brassica napus TaxID=3708 RepID=A0ABQ7X324_BRANA|nr:hypothetical protein HID58_095635 [Brassica napus]